MASRAEIIRKGDGGVVIAPPELLAGLKADGKRAIANRLALYATWMDGSGRGWTSPALDAYRDHLKAAGKKPSTITAHLSTIRARYRRLMREPMTTAALLDNARRAAEAAGKPSGLADVKAAVDLLKEQIANAIHPETAEMKDHTIQDRTADEFTRLTGEEADALMAAPGTASLRALRDTALIVLALATGLRAAELAALQVGDHRERNEAGSLAVLVRDGKGGKQRIVPYGALDFAAAVVDRWLECAGIASGPIFRGFYKDGKHVRPRAITTVAIEVIIRSYPVMVGGKMRAVKAHDLRRTYARLAYEAEMAPVAIQQNLGHADLKTTLHYIGELDDTARRPSAFLHFDLRRLPRRLV
jgi:integrase